MPKRYIPHDAWSRKAEKEGYRARSVYKLMELDERFGLLRPGMTVLDLGAAPGSWSQYAAKRIGPEGRVIALDLQAIAPIAKNVATCRQDITDLPGIDVLMERECLRTVDLVLSDAAPLTSGVKDVDQWRSIELCQAVATIARKYLKPGGRLVLKVFRGADFDDFLSGLKKSWREVRIAQVKASRDRSREIYLLARR